MEKTISKKERDYIIFNIRGFFKHYKIEQNISKISIDISNLQKMQQEVNNMLSELNELNINYINNQIYRTKILINRRHKLTTKSTDTVTKKNVEIKQKTKLNDLKYDLNKSNLISRPKTPDVSQIFNKYKKKKINNNNIGMKSNIKITNDINNTNDKNNNINDKNKNIDKNKKIGCSSFIQPNNILTKFNDNISNNSNNIINKSNKNLNNNKTLYKNKRDNSIDNKEKNFKTLNYVMTKTPTEYDKIIRQKNFKKFASKNDNGLSPGKMIIKKDSKIDLSNIKKDKSKEKNIYINKAIKTKKLRKFNTTKSSEILNERFHSSDIAQRKVSNDKKGNFKNIINKKINKKIFKMDFKRKMYVKTPSPINYRKSSPLLIDHDTIMRNKNKKINYNGNYYNEHLYYKPLQKKISNTNLDKSKKNQKHYKVISSNIINHDKDITREEEKKLDEQIINSTENNVTNNTKNIMDISQHILQNLDINIIDTSNLNNFNSTNISGIHSNIKNNKKKSLILIKHNDNSFISNYIKSLFLAIKLGFFQPEKMLNLLLRSKELYNLFDTKEIINDLIEYYEKKIKKINNTINKYDINIINKPFTPRKTGLNSLNFITKNEEQRLINEMQHDYVFKIFKIILILLNEHNNPVLNDNENNSKIFEYVFDDIYKKYNVNNIKDLFIKSFVDKIPLISDTQFEKINQIITEVPELLSPSTLLAYNRNVSYLTFFLNELYNYLNLKTDDDVYYYKIRNDYLELEKYINKINNLKTYLSK